MNGPNMSKVSETDWVKVDAMTDDMIDTTDSPPLTKEFLATATWHRPRAFVTVTIKVEADVLEWYQAQGDDYERLFSAALRIYAEAHQDLAR